MINARWFESKNFGDAINPTLIKFLSGKNVINTTKNDYYLCIGSILSYANKNSTVWGAGFISEDDKINEQPKKIYAVRGPKTKQQLIRQGFNCPKVYGDPVLLLPKFYNPKNIKKIYKYGIIPHYAEWDMQQWDIHRLAGALLIDITADWKTVVNSILSCESIASSALHGLILAEAYNIPYVWIKPSDRIIGGEFKFKDFFASLPVDLDLLLKVCPFIQKE